MKLSSDGAKFNDNKELEDYFIEVYEHETFIFHPTEDIIYRKQMEAYDPTGESTRFLNELTKAELETWEKTDYDNYQNWITNFSLD
jgi:hypothetical protein